MRKLFLLLYLGWVSWRADRKLTRLARMRRHRDADEATRSIREINSGAICFDSKGLFELLHRIGNDNNQHEFYLTDAISLLRAEGRTVIAHRADNPREVLGVNTLDEFEALG